MARVGSGYSDQIERTGHDRRPDDIDRFAALGLRALRYPVLWEREPQWKWVDERLKRIRAPMKTLRRKRASLGGNGVTAYDPKP